METLKSFLSIAVSLLKKLFQADEPKDPPTQAEADIIEDFKNLRI